ncbi:MAG: ribosome biogenesis GTP-binding protein YihA/YsxC [Candidatus Adiutrix sp.]|jgi:GTP-binding protein|nr:ribosome biogenesis GTP-binding protein YihA/YsxC [Candidatus Adiutrix sp.]
MDELKKAAPSPPALAADFVVSAAAAAQFPAPHLPEIALLGRSNAGKSSLMNRWLGRKTLARVGAAPGRTRLINFFNIVWRKGDRPFFLTDLPGYGFAAVPKAMAVGWGRLAANYLEAGRPIKTALLIMDIRRDPQTEEYGLLDWLASLNIPAWLITSKADKLKSDERSRRLAHISALCRSRVPLTRPPLAFSALTGLGREALISGLIDSDLLHSGEIRPFAEE